MRTLITPGTGRLRVRCLLVAAVVGVWAPLPGSHLAATADPAPSPQVTVSEAHGTYSVTARFEVPQPPAVVLAVLSDFEEIPRFMPDVRSSVVLERTPAHVLVEQQAVSQFMLFSKKVHLVLEVTQDADSIRFVDRSARSFKRYHGAWLATPKGSGTVVRYELAAQPAFDVPEFILKRLLKRDSGEMIANLRREFAARADR
jgi:ribosome-associated toxin RatA of RatAB toxin-antitoxin module